MSRAITFRARVRRLRDRWQRRRRLVFAVDLILGLLVWLATAAIFDHLSWLPLAAVLIALALWHRFWPHWKPPLVIELALYAALLALLHIAVAPSLWITMLAAIGTAGYVVLDHWTRPPKPGQLDGVGPPLIAAPAPQGR